MQAAESGSDSGSGEDWDRCVTVLSEMVQELSEGKAVSPAKKPPAKKRRAKYISSFSSVTVRVHVGGLHRRQ